MLSTEERYITTLEQIKKFIDYIAKSKNNEPKVAPLPEGLRRGEDDVVFKNVMDIKNFHLKYVLIANYNNLPVLFTDFLFPEYFSQNSRYFAKRVRQKLKMMNQLHQMTSNCFLIFLKSMQRKLKKSMAYFATIIQYLNILFPKCLTTST